MMLKQCKIANGEKNRLNGTEHVTVKIKAVQGEDEGDR